MTPQQTRKPMLFNLDGIRTLGLIAFLFLNINAFSQNPPNRTNQSTTPPLNDTGKSVNDIREKLVQLALQNAELEIADRKITIADYQLKRTKTEFLGNIAGTINYNEFSIKKQSALVPNFYPRYNIGVNIPLDLFITRGKDIAIARENLHIAEATKKMQAREIRGMVLTSYEDYLMHKLKLDFQNRITQDVNVGYVTAEKDFSQGIITQAEYNIAYKAWSDEQSRKSEFQRNANVAKIQLETLIGMTLEEAMKR